MNPQSLLDKRVEPTGFAPEGYKGDYIQSEKILSTHFFQLSQDLIKACVQGALGEIAERRDRFIRNVLARSGNDPGMVRLHLLYTLGQMIEMWSKRLPVQKEHFRAIFEDLENYLDGADAPSQLTLVFEEALERLMDLALRPMVVSQTLRMEGAKKFLDENFKQEIKLEKLAREHGFSTSVFGRVFKKTAGMGFSAYLRMVRIEQAKALLATTQLSISEVSRESGFNNVQYFFDVFKRSTGRTPQTYRDSAESKKDGK